MQVHKYSVGERVNFAGRVRLGAATGEYEIVRLLPAEAGQPLYRIKSVLEPHERVVGEEQLTPPGLGRG
jgi:hypothetical protein